MAELDLLIRKRGTAKFKLTNFGKYIEPLRDAFLNNKELNTKEIIELQFKVNKLELLYDEFESVQTELEMICPLDQLEKQYEERSKFSDCHVDMLAKAKEVLNRYDNNENSSISSASVPQVNVSNKDNLNFVKLPSIKCPTFNCEFNKWLEFKDTFEALFHNNSTLSEIQKYHYLRSCLGEEALKIIHSLEFAAHSYIDAWSLLCDRFDNTRLLVNNHIKALFEIETITKESSSGLRNLIDLVNKHLRALKTLKLPTEHWDALIIYMIAFRLDKGTMREWEQSKNDKMLSNLKDFFNFLKNRADFLETLELNDIQKVRDTRLADGRNTRRHNFLISGSNDRSEQKCNFCKKAHLIYKCPEFLKKTITERWDVVKKMRLCSNCLCFGHYSFKCESGHCRFCNNKHSSLLHNKNNDNQKNQSNEVRDSEKHEHTFNGSSIINAASSSNDNYVLLSTAIVEVRDSKGKYHRAQALLDSGSQCSFISEEFKNKLDLKVDSVDISISGINNSVSSNLNSKCNLLIKSTINNYQTQLPCLVVPKITDSLPPYRFNISDWCIPKNIKLANPSFNVPRPVDILIGADLFWNILGKEKILLGKDKPILIETLFGYVVTGLISSPVEKKVHCNFVVNDDLERFWSIEEIPIESPPLTKEEQICEDYFNKTVSREISGKFVVKFPLKENPLDLGDSRDLAIKRLILQENRLKKDDMLKNKYFDFMDEYIELEHMKRLTNSQSINMFRCFLPHFAVVRNDSLTTSVRIVFDASVKTKSGKSLNDIQYPGPAIQNDIFGIMLRFREHRFVVIADIAKMYRQILIHPDERYLQNIVWRNDSNDDISVYELQTVTYGTSSAPYLAIKCIKKLASDNKITYPVECELINRDMYVDDLITGFNDEEKGIVICNQISKILKSASFPLRKWASNSNAILQGLEDTSDAFSILELGENDKVKTLGLQWLSNPDLLSYKVLASSEKLPITKRTLLSNIAKIYDPLGLISPCIIIVKILIQKLWSLKLEWDDMVPSDLTNKWEYFQSKLAILNELKVSRSVMCDIPINIELHGFSDASLEAYSATVYIRTIDSSGNIYVRLLCSKTKVAPVKALTIPKLELCGALALARLVKQVSDSLTCKFEIYYWCDSQIVLCWLKTDANKLQVFVSNRVAEIKRLSEISKWSYVNTKDNPADVASRGMYPDDLYNCNAWWNGPLFLYEDANWPREIQFNKTCDIPEIRKQCNVFATTVTQFLDFDRFSSLQKLQRTLVYCLRFISNSKNNKNKDTGSITVPEIDKGMQHLLKLVQRESFATEISILQGDKQLSTKNRLLSLTPFLDSDGLLRVGGRLKHSSLSFDEKHPILLDGKHKLTKLIFQSEHKRLHHAGPQLLLYSVRQKYWATSGMNVAKMIVRNCIRCFRTKPKPINAIMGDLPKHRVEVARPFSITGVDYAGPVILRDRKGRPYKTYKAYICMFICFVTKCIHIELVTELTCEAFITAFRRFAARRGTPAHLYSDNGSNFVAAQKELKLLYDFLKNSNDEFVTSCAQQRIIWHFIPPNSPNFGGLWESNIKAIKHHLYRVIGQSVLTYEEYSTLLVQIEATLNSRPLYPMSADPNDLAPLTPAHMLIGHPLTTPPDPMFEEIKMNRLSRFQLLQQLHQSFWKKWSCFYLSELQKRHKWKVGNSNVEVGRLVVMMNDNLPPCKWILGRIVEVHPGEDGQVRVVTIKTINGTYKRAISKICPLPLNDNECF